MGKLSMTGDPSEEVKKTEYALVLVTTGRQSWLLHGVGLAIEGDLDAGLGRDEAGPVGSAPLEPGLWVWEGIPSWRSGWNSEYCVNEGDEPIYEKRGQWRRLTLEELTKLSGGDLDSLFGPPRWPPPTADVEALWPPSLDSMVKERK